ncbi:MAG TPA: IS1595 family transposase [Actinomycetota bacterium]|nr:IS1595 family transposase [Actinomycetota bacterium]
MTSKNTPPPTTLLEAVRYFSDLDGATAFVAKLRWPDGPVCPSCGHREHSYLTTRRLWKCKACKRQFSVKVGTIFEDSKIGLDKWGPAVWLVANCKNGVSSHELGRSLGVCQKTAWFMLHRIRLAMRSGSFERVAGEVEVDETFIGGKARNMHKSKRAALRRGEARTGGQVDKTPVFGVLQRAGTVQAAVIPDVSKAVLGFELRDRVAKGSRVYSDSHGGYSGLRADYDHQVVDHAERYVDGKVHTNGLENFWSLLKRGLHGTYISVEPFHLHRYLDEQVFRYNARHDDDLGRVATVLGRVEGRRLTYKALTAKAEG